MGNSHDKSKPVVKPKNRRVMDSIISFGDETDPPRNDFSGKIRRIIRKLQDISRRIDHLSSQM